MEQSLTDIRRAAGRARWEGMSPEQRREATLPARSGRGRVKDVAEQVDQLGSELLAELRAVRAELAELRAERVAA